jgi:alpha-glucosidase
MDDGKTYAFQHGAFLKMKFTCERTAQGLRLKLGPHEGTYPAWWHEVHAEIYGLAPKLGKVVVQNKEVPVHIDREPQSIGFVVADDGNGAEIEVE